MPDPPWGLFVQPDARSCGAASMVVARFLGDPAYRSQLEGGSLTSPRTVAGDGALHERFRSETLAMHQRITGLADTSGRAQIPWPRKFGTPPWAVARQLSATPGADGTTTAYSWHLARTSPSAGFERLLDATRADRVAAIFIGSTWIPRHVVLVVGATGATLSVYDPARGQVDSLDKVSFTGSHIGIAGWDVGWLVVTPD
ncbi:hypothetical protein ISU10_09775 [Nocardioides agariphilus]|uniref:Peptidase_C39 like family protein n=1 Tax=Nocardioides agariphilus TaxID=433664 RepID=A0A930VQF2_9ACTN|nr:hypothetical protein [Nocardioides agariphilus]MBF4768055.1 hypothetical protein [Nocardioides agariphilus]